MMCNSKSEARSLKGVLLSQALFSRGGEGKTVASSRFGGSKRENLFREFSPQAVTMQKGTGGNGGNGEFPETGGCPRSLAPAHPSVSLSGPLRVRLVSVPKPLLSLLAPVQ